MLARKVFVRPILQVRTAVVSRVVRPICLVLRRRVGVGDVLCRHVRPLVIVIKAKIVEMASVRG